MRKLLLLFFVLCTGFVFGQFPTFDGVDLRQYVKTRKYMYFVPNASPPAGVKMGAVYFDTDTTLYYFNGVAWLPVGGTDYFHLRGTSTDTITASYNVLQDSSFLMKHGNWYAGYWDNGYGNDPLDDNFDTTIILGFSDGTEAAMMYVGNGDNYGRSIHARVADDAGNSSFDLIPGNISMITDSSITITTVDKIGMSADTTVLSGENIYLPDITATGKKFEHLVGMSPDGRLFPQPLASGYDSMMYYQSITPTAYSTWVRDTTAKLLSPANINDTVYIPQVLKLGAELYAPAIGFQLIPSSTMDVLVKNQHTGLIHTYPLDQFTNTVDTSGYSLFEPNNTTVELNSSYDSLKIAYQLIDRSGWGLIGRDISTLFLGQDNYMVGNFTVRGDSLRNSFVARPDYFVDDTLKGNALVSIGQYSSYWNLNGDNRVNIGTFAGAYNKGNSHVSIGYAAGTSASGNILINIGDNAGSHNTGDWFIGIGDKAGEYNTGDVGEFLGYDAGKNNSGDWVTFIGYDAGAYNSGSRCYGFGQYALTRNSADTCIGIGRYAGGGNRATKNIFVGFFSQDTSYHCTKPFVNILGDWRTDFTTVDTGTTYIGGNLKLYQPELLSAERGSYIYFDDNTSLRGVASKVYAKNYVADGYTYSDPTYWMESFRKAPFYMTDFLYPTVAGINPWYGVAVSSGTFIESGEVDNHPGIGVIRNATGDDSGFRITTAISAIRNISGGEISSAIVNFPILDSVAVRIGFHDATTASDPFDGVYFEMLGDSLVGKTSKNSSRSTTTPYTISINTWYRLEIEVNTDATRVDFNIYNETGTQLWTDYLTTNIPTNRATGHGIIATKPPTGHAVIGYLLLIDYLAVYLGTLTR